ncbi:MAG TPA: ABC transporter permease [Solirubrobacterales bacterium]|jgi:ABC-2 type transport system permease protein|nr:ABC transporter permease [Solirubrobacterales bacterium]
MPSPEPKALTAPSPVNQLVDLLLIQLANWRWSWRAMVVLGIAAPTLSVALLSRVVGDRPDDFLQALLAGNVVLALMFENQNKVASHFAYMRVTGTLTFFAGLPIRQSLVVAATALAFFVLSIPAFACTALLGAALLDITLHPSPLLIVVAPCVAIAVSGIGAVIGASARSFEEVGSLALLVNLVLLAAGPVIVPASQVPDLVDAIGHLNPAVYAASALRQALFGPVTDQVIVDLAVLAAVGIGTMVIASVVLRRRMR